MGKRGRKRKGYFYEDQEDAVIAYLTEEDPIEKDKIFNMVLKPAFTKMIESIIRRYKLYSPDEEFDETFNDTISFLMTKIDHFNPTKGYKAYSYCGTICKNYLLLKLNNFAKKQSRTESYDNMEYLLAEDTKYSTEEDVDNYDFLTELMKKTCDKIQEIIDEDKSNKLSDNEIMVGKALIYLMNNWNEMFEEMGSNKFNKSSILLFLKESTLLNTTEIRDGLKKYKSAYYSIKETLMED